jgi:hypothetical protein
MLRDLLDDPESCPSVLWQAFCREHPNATDWEPDAFRIELQRLGIHASPALMAKLLGAQTIAEHDCWLADHDVLFAFALACYGVPSAYDGFHHPEPRQLAWAMREVTAIRGAAPDEHEGFDPDEIDPAVAVVLADEGWFQAPDELAFCQWVLDRMTYPAAEAKKDASERWAELRKLPLADLRGKVRDEHDDPAQAQLNRLIDARVHVLEMDDLRARQRAASHGP